jgi:adenosylcobyric acid synthase
MLGRRICDLLRVESNVTEVEGLGLLSVVTTFEAEKQTVRAAARVIATQGLFANMSGVEIKGYEIHMGRTDLGDHIGSPLQVLSRGNASQIPNDFDGAVSADGWIAGTYFHGLFDNDALREAMLGNLAARKNVSRRRGAGFDREKMYERLAEVVRATVDMRAIYHMMGR